LACVLPLGGLFWDRFDIFPAMFSLLAVYLATKKSFWSLPVLTLGILTKLYPVILLPVILGSLLKRKGYFAILYGAFISLVFVGYSFLFFPNWFNCVFGFHGNRGIQIESIRSIPKLSDENSVVEFKHNTFEIR
jgi:Gpi18-like mannosyltransferase